MQNLFNTLKHPALFVIILGTVFSFGLHISNADQDENALSRKKVLSARLDSIEMEKQARKRRGEPLGDLEEESGRIYDSIAALRVKILETDESILHRRKAAGKESLIAPFLKPFTSPAHAFDWIIIVVGFIALLSGIVLIIGLITTVFKRSKRKPKPSKRPPPKKSYTEKISQGSPKIPPSDSYLMTDKNDRSIDALRSRMQKDIEDIQRFNTEDSPFTTQDDEQASPAERENKDTVREQIIRAAREGLDVQEISRRYHISVDQVSLILRVAKKGHSKNS